MNSSRTPRGVNYGRLPTGRSYKNFIAMFLFFSLLLGGFIIYFTFSEADVIVYPENKEIEHELEVNIVPSSEVKNYDFKTIEGRLLESYLENSIEITEVPVKGVEKAAEGKIKLFNKRGEAQPLLKDTQLMSDSGVLFKTKERVVVPANGEVEVMARADVTGENGNIGPEHFTIVKLWKDWQDLIYGESSAPMNGGFVEVSFVDEEEMNKATQQLKEDTREKILPKFKERLSSDENITTMGIKADLNDFNSSTELNSEADSFSISANVHLVAVVFDEKKVKEMLSEQIRENITTKEELMGVNQESFRYEVADYDLSKRKAKIRAKMSAFVMPKIADDFISKERLIGLTKIEAEKYLENLPEVIKAEVSLSPLWVKAIPGMEEHINISVKKEN